MTVSPPPFRVKRGILDFSLRFAQFEMTTLLPVIGSVLSVISSEAKNPFRPTKQKVLEAPYRSSK